MGDQKGMSAGKETRVRDVACGVIGIICAACGRAPYDDLHMDRNNGCVRKDLASDYASAYPPGGFSASFSSHLYVRGVHHVFIPKIIIVAMTLDGLFLNSISIHLKMYGSKIPRDVPKVERP